ncbi:MAG: Maf family protein [Eubacteriales bacterium]|nr:Maf family protein [Eubacteriales bacterium]
MDRFILASQSPRRRELLRAVIPEYEVIPAKGEEIVTESDPALVVEELSRQKAMEVAGKVQPCEGDRIIVIGADTVVAVDGEILGKPVDRADAARMIGMIRGRTHHVYTGVTVCCVEGEDSADPCVPVTDLEAGESGDGSSLQNVSVRTVPVDTFSFHEETAVDVFPMNKGEVEGYISLKEPYDKAGAYGIQGAFCIFIRGIHGDYNNVVGLPVARLYHEMSKRGLL